LLALLFSLHSLLNSNRQKDSEMLAQLIREQAQFGDHIQEETITETIKRAELKAIVNKKYIKSYLPLAIIYDICHFTPDWIHLTSMVYSLDKDKKNQGDISKKLFIKGQVSAPPQHLDSKLGNYILKLSESPILGDIEITNKQITPVNNKKSLFFNATLEVL
jgi:hypothetical protein